MSILLVLLTSFARAHVKPTDVVAVQTPRGVKVVTVTDVPGASTPDELVAASLPQTQGFVYREKFKRLGRPIGEQTLYPEFRAQADMAVSRFVRLAVGLMRARGIHLDTSRGTTVRFETEPLRITGRTTPGLIDTCWECYGGDGNREYAAYALGLEVGSLEGRGSQNPRFTRQLVRNSAALYKFNFVTVERGEIRVGLALELAESYHPFVADVPVNKELFGQRVMGSSQRVKLRASAELDATVFGRPHLEWVEFDQFSVTSVEMPKRSPNGFAEVADRAISDRPRAGFLPRVLRDFGEHLRAIGMLSRGTLVLPGSPWFWE